MKRLVLLFTLLMFCYVSTFSQVSYYADSFTGGVTGAGYAPAYDNSGTGVINIYIYPGSTIRRAFLFAGRQGLALPVTITLNGTPLTFDSSNAVSPIFHSPDYGDTSAVHAIDVSSVVNASVTSYTLAVPYQRASAKRFTDFYLFISYYNSSLPMISTQFFVNNKNFAPSVIDTFNLAFPVNSTQPVAVGLDMGYMCGGGDADEVFLNGNDLGFIYGPEANSGTCQGPCANFYYQNDTAYGLLDNNADQAMNGPDVLSNAQALIPNNSTSFTMRFTHPNSDNAHWGFFIVSGSTCTPPVATAGPDTGICYGNSANLYADGGISYLWSPGTGLSDSTVSNPLVRPSVSTTYTVTVSNACGSSSSTAAIVVYPSPPTPGITTSNDTLYCSIDPSYISYQWYFNNTMIAGATGTSCIATQSGNYNVAVTDSNGCFISVGINIIGLKSLFAVYGLKFTLEPNNVHDVLNIISQSSSASNKMPDAIIYNILGEKVSRFKISGLKSSIDMSSLSRGVYLIQITGNKEIWTGRFVKE